MAATYDENDGKGNLVGGKTIMRQQQSFVSISKELENSF